jgi:hypothetical protein
MIVVFGTRMYGKVDQVPGVFYVATRFFHIQFVPLIPVGSFLVIDGSESDDNFQGVSVGLSIKSVFFAWLRAFLLLGGIIIGIIGVIALLAEGKKGGFDLLEAIAMIAACPVMLVGWWFSYRLAYAGPERALRLAHRAGIPPEVIVEAFAPSGHPPVVPEVDEHAVPDEVVAHAEEPIPEVEPVDEPPRRGSMGSGGDANEINRW